MRTSKKPVTTKTRVTRALRQLWLRSKERTSVLQRYERRCKYCGRKLTASKAKLAESPGMYVDKIAVHHEEPVFLARDWNEFVDLLIFNTDGQVTACKPCHKLQHALMDELADDEKEEVWFESQ